MNLGCVRAGVGLLDRDEIRYAIAVPVRELELKRPIGIDKGRHSVRQKLLEAGRCRQDVNLYVPRASGSAQHKGQVRLAIMVPVEHQGACAVAGIGTNMGIAMKDDGNGQRQFAELLAAKTAGTTVNVRVDDTVKNGNGYCYLEFLW
jgi:hypothetical protein